MPLAARGEIRPTTECDSSSGSAMKCTPGGATRRMLSGTMTMPMLASMRFSCDVLRDRARAAFGKKPCARHRPATR